MSLGPTVLFDKSFIQSLNPDEAVWFDHFFIGVICPYFFVETLADLEKPPRPGLTAEEEVAHIAEKFPEQGGMPNALHPTLCIHNLLGNDVPMDGRIFVPEGRKVTSKGRTGVSFPRSEEAEAFERWKAGDFRGVERMGAKRWRAMLADLDLSTLPSSIPEVQEQARTCGSLDAVHALARSFVASPELSEDRVRLILALMDAPREVAEKVVRRHQAGGRPPLPTFAPYAAHVLEVEIFLIAGLASGQISGERPSNRIDIAYLHYLPFCQMFVSWDSLHRRAARFLLRPDQYFFWGPDLKAGLRELDEHYKALPEEVRERGIFAFAGEPPHDDRLLIPRIWDGLYPGWRDKPKRSPMSPEEEKRLIEELKAMQAGEPAAGREQLGPAPESPPDYLFTQHRIRKKRGSWYQLSKDFKEE